MSSKSAPESAPAVRRPWSLAGRLTAWYACSAFVLVLAATGSLYWALAASLDRDDDAYLAATVRALRHRPDERAGPPAGAEGESDKVFVRVLGAGGRTLTQTTGMDEALPAT